MPLSVNEELRRTFELATLRREARAIEGSRQWREVMILQTRCQNARVREKDRYAERYDTRVELRRRQLIDEAGTKSRDFKPWWGGRDRFSPEDTLRQAQRDVRAAHAARIQRIDDIERRSLSELVTRFQRENAVRGLARDDFNRAMDRRTGWERRRPRQREH